MAVADVVADQAHNQDGRVVGGLVALHGLGDGRVGVVVAGAVDANVLEIAVHAAVARAHHLSAQKARV